MQLKTIIKTYKFKILPTDVQKEQFSQWFGCKRWVFNQCAEVQLKRKENNEKLLSNFELDKMLTQWKAEHSFLKNPNSQALQQVTKDIKRAVNSYFKNIKLKKNKNKVFNFKSKYFPVQSISFSNYKENCKWVHNYTVFKKPKTCYMQIPKLNGYLKILKHRNVEGVIKNVTLSKEIDCYYISLQTEQAITLPDNITFNPIGLDAGVNNLLYTSEGEKIEPLNAFQKQEKKLARFQRQLSRATKQSNNYRKLKDKIAKIHRKIKHCRKNYLHHLANRLIKSHNAVIVEKLNIKNMTASKNKSLNKSIHDQGWSMLFTILEYKLKWSNGYFSRENCVDSSIECSHCHSKQKQNRISQSQFVCKTCGNTLHADFNAALNMLYRGLDSLKLSNLQELINKKRISGQERGRQATSCLHVLGYN